MPRHKTQGVMLLCNGGLPFVCKQRGEKLGHKMSPRSLAAYTHDCIVVRIFGRRTVARLSDRVVALSLSCRSRKFRGEIKPLAA
jgi:hypothetical protein